jgi:peptidoglycan/LPS O-acetylase OafA/YrhL
MCRGQHHWLRLNHQLTCRVSWLMPENAVQPVSRATDFDHPAQSNAAQREFYIDRLRSVMTVFVILHHTAITYGASGSWFYNELRQSRSVSSTMLTLFVATNQAYFMGFFFLLSGYFTPGSLERKGYGRFIGDRFLRLGVPLVVFTALLGPMTAALVSAANGNGFWATVAWILTHGPIITGPMWFVQALLMFTLAYCAWRAVAGMPLADANKVPSPVPSQWWWLLSAIGVGAAALAIRQVVPVGQNVIGLQLGYFSSYIFLFALGIAAWRHDWLARLQWKQARRWVLRLGLIWPLMPLSVLLARASKGPVSFASGLSWPAIVYALWEPFVAWGLIAMWLLLFRAKMNKPSAIWTWLNRRAYAVYIIHPLVLVGVALLLRGWIAPPLIKFAGVGALSCAATWLLADPLVRMPGVRRIV